MFFDPTFMGPMNLKVIYFLNILFFRRYKSNPRIIFKPFRNIINSSILDIFIIPPSCLSLFTLYLISVWGGECIIRVQTMMPLRDPFLKYLEQFPRNHISFPRKVLTRRRNFWLGQCLILAF